jgi:hypothetical protein
VKSTNGPSAGGYEAGHPRTDGDPHIRTVDGISYDFQGAGEFVLLRDDYLEVQVRQTPVETGTSPRPNAHTGLSSCVTLNGAVALRIGRDRVTYQPNISGQPHSGGLQLRINGKLTELREQGIPLSGGRIVRTKSHGGIQVEARGGTVIVITPGWWDHQQLLYMNIDTRQIRATQGLTGSIVPGNWLPALPDGTLMGPRPEDLRQRYQDLYVKFANAWRVNDTNSLFDYAPGTSTRTFTIENWPGIDPAQNCTLPPEFAGRKTRLPVKALTQEEAEQCCIGIVDEDRKANCIQDVMVTGDRGFAKTYLQADEIARNATPTPPLLVFPEDFRTNVVNPISFTWNHATDADGDPISYRHYVWPVDQVPNDNDAVPVSSHITPRKIILYPLVLGLLVSLLLAALVFVASKKQPSPLVIAVVGILATVVFAYFLGTRTASHTKAVTQMVFKTVSDLQPGKAYFWKVIAEDDKGGTAESEIRRFEIK